MCDERERLIGYVYDECDEHERRTIDAHLDACATCQTEIGGFRRVRQDLLAWNVPEHDSVWRAFAPARVTPWWRDVPVWAMAAAALAMFTVGAAGGVVTHALAVPDEVTVAEVRSSPTGSGVTPAELTAFEARLLGLMRTEVSSLRPRSGGALTAVDLSAAEARLFERVRAEIDAADERQLERIRGFEALLQTVGIDMVRTTRNVNDLENQLRAVVNERGGAPGGLK